MFIDLISQPVFEALDEQQHKLEDTEPLMKELAGVLEEAVNYNFDTEGRGDWEPLSETTKSRGRDGGKILQDTRLLSGSIVAESSEREAMVGTNDIRAATHQFGAKKGEYGTTSKGAPIPWGDIPAREFMFLGDDDVEEMQEITDNYFEV